jgi:hypothetical protein
VALDNTYSAEIEAFVKQGGEYRMLPYKKSKRGVCDFYKDDTYFYPDLAAATDFPFPFECPVANVRLLM